MIDEKHRHEIAEAMRRCDHKAFRWPIGLAAAIAQASDGGQDLLRELADLIDRPTCGNVSGCQDVFECSECRCRAELVTEVCNEYGEPFHVPLMPSFCPNCGAEVVREVVGDDED